MMIMTTYLILAGGKSSRMKQDKSMMERGTNRIYQLCKSMGKSSIITLCGDESRIDFFEGEVWPDPTGLRGALDIIKWCFNNIEDRIQLIPCDAFNLEKEALSWLDTFDNATPVDYLGNRQPLLSVISDKEKIDFSANDIRGLFSNIPSVVNEKIAGQFNNFNTEDDLSKLGQFSS